MDLDIMFDDLTEECQKRVLKHFGVSSPEEMNWDVFPFTSIPVDKEEYVEMEQAKKRRKGS